jgi:hypothetical protein
MRRFIVSCAALALLGLAGCATGTGSGSPATSGPGATPGSTSAGGSPGRTPNTSPDPGGQYRVRYGWAVPSQTVEIDNPVSVPSDPSAIPLPYLVEIRTGDHATERPGYGRISFYFQGGFPGYKFRYTDKVLTQGGGEPVSLDGNSFLEIVFNPAQAHDNDGRSTIRSAANKRIGFTNLKSYGFAGDFEGYLACGLGIAVKPGSDQALPIRVGELRRGDIYIVAVDVQAG